jgi:hypothetical protein
VLCTARRQRGFISNVALGGRARCYEHLKIIEVVRNRAAVVPLYLPPANWSVGGQDFLVRRYLDRARLGPTGCEHSVKMVCVHFDAACEKPTSGKSCHKAGIAEPGQLGQSEAVRKNLDARPPDPCASRQIPNYGYGSAGIPVRGQAGAA